MFNFFSLSNVLIGLGTILAAWANFWLTSKRRQRRREALVFVGVVVSAVGGLWASSQQAAYEQQLTSMTSGGDSFCYVVFLFASDDLNRPQLGVHLEGKYSLHNIHMVVRDVDRMNAALPNAPQGKENMRQVTQQEMDTFDKLSTILRIPSLGPPGTTLRVRGWYLPENIDKITYTINFSTPFQSFEQYLKLRKVNGSWKQAYRVHKNIHDEEIVVLEEHVDSGFPPDKMGKVNWDYLLND